MTENSNKWLVILNPHAGARKGMRDMELVLELLGKNGIDHHLEVSEYQGHIVTLTMTGIEKGFRKILVAGGDGSLNEVVNGIFLQKEVHTTEITIGMLPVGTGNDWIRTFGIPDDYQKSLDIIKLGKTILQDVGQIIYEQDAIKHERFFANMAGFGFDAIVASKVNTLKDEGWSGIKLYLWALLYSYFKYNTKRMKISVDGKLYEDWIFTTSIGIGKYNGGGMMQSPDAIPNNGQFNITMIRKIGVWGILSNLAGLYSGKYVKDHRVSSTVGKKIEISSQRNIPGEADGEKLGQADYKIEILPLSLKVVCGGELSW